MFLWNLPFESYYLYVDARKPLGLNPCFCGTYLLSRKGIISEREINLVLILVFVELTFWGCAKISDLKRPKVLILVFVELTFWDFKGFYDAGNKYVCLNPCFCGTYLLRIIHVLNIITVVESLNPCFCGTYLLS